eukprot:1161195-Pelagomonas_calceolata.AAC.16
MSIGAVVRACAPALPAPWPIAFESHSVRSTDSRYTCSRACIPSCTPPCELRRACVTSVLLLSGKGHHFAYLYCISYATCHTQKEVHSRDVAL